MVLIPTIKTSVLQEHPSESGSFKLETAVYRLLTFLEFIAIIALALSLFQYSHIVDVCCAWLWRPFCVFVLPSFGPSAIHSASLKSWPLSSPMPPSPSIPMSTITWRQRTTSLGWAPVMKDTSHWSCHCIVCHALVAYIGTNNDSVNEKTVLSLPFLQHSKVDGAYCLGFFKNADGGALLGGEKGRN